MNPTLAKIIIGQIFLHACMAGTRLAAPLWALKQGYTAAPIGIMMALFSLAGVVLALPAGRFIDRHPLQRPLGFCVIVATLGAALMAIIPKFWVLYIAAVATGGGAGIAVIAFQRYVGRATTDTLELKKAFSWLTIGPAVSNFIGPLMTGLLIDHVSFAAAFTAIACLPMLCWLCIRHTPLLPVVICHKTSTTTSKSSAWDLMRNPAMQRLLLVNLLFSVSWELHTVVVPLFGHEQGYNASTIGTILGAFAVAAASVRVLLSLLAANLREWVILMIAMLATAILFGIYPLMPNAWAMGGCSVLLGLALGSVQPMILSALHYITPENRQGEALGLRSMTVNAAGVAMPMLLGVASVAVGVAGIFWSVAALMGLSAKLAKNLQHDIHVTQ